MFGCFYHSFYVSVCPTCPGQGCPRHIVHERPTRFTMVRSRNVETLPELRLLLATFIQTCFLVRNEVTVKWL